MEAATKSYDSTLYAASASQSRDLEDERKEEARPDVSSGSSLLSAPVHWSRERVYGHEIAPDVDGGVAEKLRGAIAAAKEERRARKLAIAQEVYGHRQQFRADAERKDLAKTPEGSEFLARFGVGGRYDVQNTTAQVTTDRIHEHLERQGLENFKLRDHAETRQTHVYHEGRHVMTLHRGRSAFHGGSEPTPDLPRRMVRKHGSEKDYVLDDRGVPTRRYGYAIKDSDQVGILNGGSTLRGRFISLEGHGSVMESTERERAELGETADQIQARPNAPHNENNMLFLHQEFGSNNRQRGVSIASTASPLLSNEGRGFARPDDDEARKLQIDLARVPPRQHGAPPNLINFYQQIPGFEDQRVVPPNLHWTTRDPVRPGERVSQQVPLGADPGRQVKFSAHQGAQRWAWSTGKNRELFLRELSPQYIAGRARPSTLERTHFDPRAVEEEYRAAKTEPYLSEHALGLAPRRVPAHVPGPLPLSAEAQAKADRDALKQKRADDAKKAYQAKLDAEAQAKQAQQKKDPGPDKDGGGGGGEVFT